MSFRSDAIEITQGIIDALGESFYYQPPNGVSKPVDGVFDSEYIEQGNVAGKMPTMCVNSADANFKEGGVFVIDNIKYSIVAIEPDSDGMIKCMLEKRIA